SIAQNLVGQGIAHAVGVQKGFSWASVVASAVGGMFDMRFGGSGSVTEPGKLGGFSNSSIDGGFSWSAVGSNTLRSLGRNVVTTTTQIAINGHGKLDLLSVTADAFGNALGNSMAESLRPTVKQPVEAQTARNNDSLSIEDNFRRGLGERLDAYYDDKYRLGLRIDLEADQLDRIAETGEWNSAFDYDGPRTAEFGSRVNNIHQNKLQTLNEMLRGSAESQLYTVKSSSETISDYLLRVSSTTGASASRVQGVSSLYGEGSASEINNISMGSNNKLLKGWFGGGLVGQIGVDFKGYFSAKVTIDAGSGVRSFDDWRGEPSVRQKLGLELSLGDFTIDAYRERTGSSMNNLGKFSGNFDVYYKDINHSYRQGDFILSFEPALIFRYGGEFNFSEAIRRAKSIRSEYFMGTDK
ncbi:MAG: hypothetical protein Q8L72_00925, partial [Moraxellaceae bacterium]|nr:hypothetical protein [Moraxellaceae bacterium]